MALRRRRLKQPKFDPAKYKGGRLKRYDAIARDLLSTCDRIWAMCERLDTAVSDVTLDGLARLLHVAYDCQACSLGLDGAAFSSFIGNSTAEWFRERGCAEWYCTGSATLFTTSRPRVLVHVVKKKDKRVGFNAAAEQRYSEHLLEKKAG